MPSHSLRDFFLDPEIVHTLHPVTPSKFFGTEEEHTLFMERMRDVFGEGNGLEVFLIEDVR